MSLFLVQDCSISIANALEILQSCTKLIDWFSLFEAELVAHISMSLVQDCSISTANTLEILQSYSYSLLICSLLISSRVGGGPSQTCPAEQCFSSSYGQLSYKPFSGSSHHEETGEYTNASTWLLILLIVWHCSSLICSRISLGKDDSGPFFLNRHHLMRNPHYTIRMFPPAIDIIPTLLAVVYCNGKYTN